MPLMSEYRGEKWLSIPKHKHLCIHCAQYTNGGSLGKRGHKPKVKRINIGGRYWNQSDDLLHCPNCGEWTPVYVYWRWRNRHRDEG